MNLNLEVVLARSVATGARRCGADRLRRGGSEVGVDGGEVGTQEIAVDGDTGGRAAGSGLTLDGDISERADLVEAYAGDTNSLIARTDAGPDDATRTKEAREAAALERIRDEFALDFPWLTDTIDAYESLAQPEARFVKALDKVLPKITHILNRGATLREHGVDASNIDAVNGSQVAKMQASYAADQPAVMSLYADVHTLLRETLEKQHAIANERFLDGLPSERLRQVWSKWEASHGTVYIFDGEFYRCDFWAAGDKSISISSVSAYWSAYAFRPLGATWAEVEALAAAAAKP